MHILIEPFFFLTNKTGAPRGKMLGLTKPLSNNSCNCIFNSPNYAGAILYDVIEIGVAPGNNSMVKSVSLTGGNPVITSRKISGNLQTMGISSTPWDSLSSVINAK